MSKVICMASAKGGSGKTVLTATFSSFLKSLGKTVLIIDVDASTNGLTLMYLKEVMLQSELSLSTGKKAAGIYETTDKLLLPTITILPNEVHLIPSTYSFINTEDVNPSMFKAALRHLKTLVYPDYDYIFLDAQAGSDHFAECAMKKDVSNEVVIVSEYDPLSAAGVERLKALFREDLTYNRTWVLLNKMLPDFVQSFSDFLEVAKYLSPIPWDAEVVKAYSRRKLALDIEWGNDYTLAIVQTLKSLLGDDIKADIDKWVFDKASVIKQPIEIQYTDTEKKLEQLLILQNSQRKDYRKKDSLNIVSSFAAIFTFAVAGYSIVRFMSKPNFGLDLNNLTMVAVVATTLFSVVIMTYRLLKYPKNQETDLTDYKIAREIKTLEEKLFKLENLKSSSPEEILKANIGKQL